MGPLGISGVGGGTPGGSNTQVQYNSNGAFNGSPGLTWDQSNQHVIIKRDTATANQAALTVQDPSGNIVTTFTYDGRIAVNQHPDQTSLAGEGFSFVSTKQYYPQAFFENRHASNPSPYIFFAKRWGNDAVPANCILGTFTFRGWDGSAFAALGAIDVRMGDPVNPAASMPTNINISLTPHGYKVNQRLFTFTADRYFGVNNTSPSASIDAIATDTTASNFAFKLKDSALTDLFTIRNDGGFTFKGGTVAPAQTGYSTTGVTLTRALNTSGITTATVANILGTLIQDLMAKGIIRA